MNPFESTASGLHRPWCAHASHVGAKSADGDYFAQPSKRKLSSKPNSLFGSE